METKDEETKRLVCSIEEKATEIERICADCGPDLCDVLDVDRTVETVAGVGVLRSHRILDELGKCP